MSSVLESLRIKAKLLQKAKKKSGRPFRLKEAFELLAGYAGFASWREMKEVYEANEIFCPKGSSAHWKTWYGSYEDAKAHLTSSTSFLLPYRRHFFVCEASYVEFLGVASDDPDLAKVGRNWVEPRDQAAWACVLAKIRAAVANRD